MIRSRYLEYSTDVIQLKVIIAHTMGRNFAVCERERESYSLPLTVSTYFKQSWSPRVISFRGEISMGVRARIMPNEKRENNGWKESEEGICWLWVVKQRMQIFSMNSVMVSPLVCSVEVANLNLINIHHLVRTQYNVRYLSSLIPLWSFIILHYLWT